MTNKHHSFGELRASYPVFEYQDYSYNMAYGKLNITYNFAIPRLKSFSPTWTIPIPPSAKYSDEILNRLVFSLGLMELVSYWKCTCSPTVVVKCGCILPDEVQWWKHLYFYGLQEFFYINNIACNIDSFMSIVCESVPCASPTERQLNLHGCLVPVGGGKDSCVTLELTADIESRSAFIIGDRHSSVECAKISAVEDIIISARTISKELLELNAEGFLNGHTPFSGIVAFSSLLTAYLHQKKYIFLSNEASASEPTVIGTDINHQYSKSFEFENNFRHYVKSFSPVPEIEYLSLLRPISELQIAGIFSGLEKYHRVFRSCNRGARTDSWCCSCAKCLFVFIMLAAFMDYDKVVEIFGGDMLNDTAVGDALAELIGQRETKPFECVGTVHEAQQAIGMIVKRLRLADKKIPVLLENLSFNVDKDSLTALEAEHNLDNTMLNKLRRRVEHLGDSI